MCVAVYFKQNSIVFVPTVGEPHSNPAKIGLKFEDLMIDSGGKKIHAWYVPAEENRGTVLFCHGNAGNLGHRLTTINIWNRLGLNILIFDYQGYGKSEGSPTEEACYSDVKACFQWLEENEKVQRPLIIHGRSVGGGPACWGADNLEFDGLILESTFTSIPDAGANQFPFLPVRMLSKIDFNNKKILRSVDIPVLIFHGKGDEVIPYSMGLELAKAAGVELNELQGAHNGGFDITPSYTLKLEEFISRLNPQTSAD